MVQYLTSTIDRLEEAHWNIHQMEDFYHESDPFRFALNSFLRVIKEVPQILQMELQGTPGFTAWVRERRQSLFDDPLLSDLFKKRDIVVHRATLKPRSQAILGLVEGRRLKFGLGLPLDPMHDSDVLMVRYLSVCADGNDEQDVFGILMDDEDSLPCIERHWGLKPFEQDILDLAAAAWSEVAKFVSDAQIQIGQEPCNHQLPCIHSSASVQIRRYQRDWINRALNYLKTEADFWGAVGMLSDMRRN